VASQITIQPTNMICFLQCFDRKPQCLLLLRKQELNLCGDETTWGHGGFGEAGEWLEYWTTNYETTWVHKRGGVQIVIIEPVCIRIRPACLRRHKLHVKPPGWTGLRSEKPVRRETTNRLVQENLFDGRRQIFEEAHSSIGTIFPVTRFATMLGKMGLV
jgi:hypothetical protein